MLNIVVPAGEAYDEEKGVFVYTKERKLALEHSLVSISKWESKWHKPYISSKKTIDEVIDYIRCMTLTQNVDPNVYLFLSDNNLKEIDEYIKNPMTATWFNDKDTKENGREQLTNELLYYYMFKLGIPKECEKWHLNRLITLINVFSAKEKPVEKKKPDLVSRKALNDMRRKQMHTRG